MAHVDVVVDKGRFRSNVRFLRSLIDGKIAESAIDEDDSGIASRSKLCLVMKTDAYGCGVRELAPIAVEEGADYIGLCSNDEMKAVRQIDSCSEVRLLRLRPVLREEAIESVRLGWNIEEQIGSRHATEMLQDIASTHNTNISVHINVDMGMGRTGFLPTDDQDLSLIQDIAAGDKYPQLRIVGVMTHLPCADHENLSSTESTIEDMNSLLEKIRHFLPDDVLIHCGNTAATVRLCGSDLFRNYNMFRVGAGAYGHRTTLFGYKLPAHLHPIMSVRTKVLEIRRLPPDWTIGYDSTYRTNKESYIASLPVGFGEGYPRSLANKGEVLICGHRCPVVGRVSLNIVTVDITHLIDMGIEVQPGEETVLFGTQCGEEITFEEMAFRANTVHTEFNLWAGFASSVRYEDSIRVCDHTCSKDDDCVESPSELSRKQGSLFPSKVTVDEAVSLSRLLDKRFFGRSSHRYGKSKRYRFPIWSPVSRSVPGENGFDSFSQNVMEETENADLSKNIVRTRSSDISYSPSQVVKSASIDFAHGASHPLILGSKLIDCTLYSECDAPFGITDTLPRNAFDEGDRWTGHPIPSTIATRDSQEQLYHASPSIVACSDVVYPPSSLHSNQDDDMSECNDPLLQHSRRNSLQFEPRRRGWTLPEENAPMFSFSESYSFGTNT